MLRPYIVSRVRSSLINFFFFCFSLSLFLSLVSPINHLCSRTHSSASLSQASLSLHIRIPSIILSLFLHLSVIRSLSLGKIIPILRYTLEKYAMPKIGWRPEGNHSVDITDNRCLCVCLCFIYIYVCVCVYVCVNVMCIRVSTYWCAYSSIHDSDFSHQRS